MGSPLCLALTLLDNNQILVSGGGDYNDVELFNYATRQAKALSPMSEPREGHCATLLKNKMVLITGGVKSYVTAWSAELYDADSGKSILVLPMKYSCMDHCAHKLSDKRVLLVGGRAFWPGESDGGHLTDEAQLFCSK